MEEIDINKEFVTIYGLYQPRLTKIAMRYVRDPLAAEDIVSDSFVSFYKTYKTLPPDSNKASYLVTIVKNNCLNYLYAKQNHLRIEQNIHASHLRLVEENIRSLQMCDPQKLFANEVHVIIMDTLSKLSETDRQVFEKSRFEGKTYMEIAQDCDITVRKVTSIIQNVLAKLRKALKDYLE